MSESTAEPLAPQADATPAPTLDETMDRVYDEFTASDDPAETQVAPADGEAPAEGPARGADGKFVANETPVGETQTEPPPSPEAQQAAPTVPDYIAPYQADFAMRGLTPDQAVPILVDTWRNIERNPQAGIAELAGRYGLKVNFGDTPPAQTQTATEPQAGDWVDPNITRLEAEIQALKAKDAHREQMTQQQQEAVYRQAYASVNTEIQDFAKSKAAAEGINFDLLRPKMAALIVSGEATDLADAYEQAVYANPTTRVLRLTAERKQSEAAAAKASAEKAQAARRAGVINVRADTASPQRGRSIDETMNRVYDEVAARG